MSEDSGATAIASVPKIDTGLEKAMMLEMFIMAQIRVKHVSFLTDDINLWCKPNQVRPRDPSSSRIPILSVNLPTRADIVVCDDTTRLRAPTAALL